MYTPYQDPVVVVWARATITVAKLRHETDYCALFSKGLNHIVYLDDVVTVVWCILLNV